MQEKGILQRLKTKWWKEMHGGGKCLVSFDLTSKEFPHPSLIDFIMF